MALLHHPNPGEILTCSFDDVAVGAEMVKRRPAIVVSRRETHSRGLCTVVPLSTTAPLPPRAWHHPMPHLRVIGWQAAGDIWAKCDVLCTVSTERLRKPYTKTRHGRNHVTQSLDPTDLAAVLACIRAYLAL